MAGAEAEKDTQIRDMIVYSRLTEQEHIWLVHMSRTERRTKSDMIRLAVVEAAMRRELAEEESAA